MYHTHPPPHQWLLGEALDKCPIVLWHENKFSCQENEFSFLILGI